MSEWTVVGKKNHDNLIYYPPPLRSNYKQPDTQTPRCFFGRELKQDSPKIQEPCWFYNNGGCKHKDGTEKLDSECKYLHILSENVKRPPHLGLKKPCDKYNLEGECKWIEVCKYSHRHLTAEEWSIYYPEIPYSLKTNLQRLIQIESTLIELERRVKILEFKQEGMSRDIVFIKKVLGDNLNKLDLLLSGSSLNI